MANAYPARPIRGSWIPDRKGCEMLMQTQPQVSLNPKEREAMKLPRQLQIAAERARKDQPAIKALASNVDEYRMLWRE